MGGGGGGGGISWKMSISYSIPPGRPASSDKWKAQFTAISSKLFS